MLILSTYWALIRCIWQTFRSDILLGSPSFPVVSLIPGAVPTFLQVLTAILPTIVASFLLRFFAYRMFTHSLVSRKLLTVIRR